MVVINIIMNYGFNMVQEKVPGDIRNECVHSSHHFKWLSLCSSDSSKLTSRPVLTINPRQQVFKTGQINSPETRLHKAVSMSHDR